MTVTSSPSSVLQRSVVTGGSATRLTSFPHIVCRWGPGNHQAGLKAGIGMLVDCGGNSPNQVLVREAN